MKKKVLKRNTRQSCIAVLLFLLVLTLAGLYWSLTRPPETTEKYTAYSYTQEADLQYRVNLYPNELFAESSLEAGRAYLSALTETIDTDFTYRFSAEQEARIRGEYSVMASIEALTGKENHVVWEKSFILHPPDSFFSAGKEVFLKETVVLPFSEYAALAEEIMEQTAFIPEILNLVITYDVFVTAETPDGSIEEATAPNLVIPLKGKVFSVGGQLEDKSAGEITATRQLPVPYYEEAKHGFALLAGLLLLLLLILVQLTVAKEEKNSFVKHKLSRILKIYRDRVVKCTEEIPILNTHSVLQVGSFEDMVKAADELEKPILYYPAREEGEHSFFVISEQYVYRYNLGASSLLSGNTLSRKQLVKHLR